jgi:hypothetical protein
MRSQDKAIFFLLIIFIFLEGLWLTKIFSWISHLLDIYGYKSPLNLLRNLFLVINQKIPVVAVNLPQLIWAFFHLIATIIALKLYFQWKNKYAFYFFLFIYTLFLLVSFTLIFLSASNPRFFKVWGDFINLFISPFPLIFISLMIKLTNKM